MSAKVKEPDDLAYETKIVPEKKYRLKGISYRKNKSKTDVTFINDFEDKRYCPEKKDQEISMVLKTKKIQKQAKKLIKISVTKAVVNRTEK